MTLSNKRAIIAALVAANIVTSVYSIDSISKGELSILELENKNKELNSEINNLKSENKKLSEELDFKINNNSAIGQARSELVDVIINTVKQKGIDSNNPGLNIAEIDAMRALKSAEDRIIDEYIRLTSLVLATMEVETGFKHIVNENPNGTKDYGIMQVNDKIIPEIKEMLGSYIDPVNNRNHNVEGGSYEIYDCYTLSKERHPEDVIWWTYAYYNRGRYFENKDTWKDPKNPSYKLVRKQADVRSKKFKSAYESYYNALKEAL